MGPLTILPSSTSPVGTGVGPAGHVAGVLLSALHLVSSVPGTLFAPVNVLNIAGAAGMGTGGATGVCKESKG